MTFDTQSDQDPDDGAGADDRQDFGLKINKLCSLASNWIEAASAAEIWHVLEHGGIDARVGMSGLLPELGKLPGPGSTFREQLAIRDWAPELHPFIDLAFWFEANAEAQRAVRHELQGDVTEVLFGVGAGEWTSIEFGGG
jgi:hypothetical protein